jgi:hypothetical protein
MCNEVRAILHAMVISIGQDHVGLARNHCHWYIQLPCRIERVEE